MFWDRTWGGLELQRGLKIALWVSIFRAHSHNSIVNNGHREVGVEHVVGQRGPLDPQPMGVSHDLMHRGELHLRGQAPGPVGRLDAELHKVLLLVEKTIDLNNKKVLSVHQ